MTRTSQALTVLALALATFLSALDATVVSTVMPTVAPGLHGMALYPWVFTAYMASSTATMPLAGKLADLYGRKRILLLGLFFFSVGSATAGHANTMLVLVAARAVQGFGAGAIMPACGAIVGDLFDATQQARVNVLFTLVWVGSFLLGPFIGGLVIQYASWRWVFYANIPLALLTGGVLVFFFEEHVESRKRRLDFAGAFLLLALVLCLLAVGESSIHSSYPTIATPILLVSLLVVERRAADAVLPLTLFRNRVVAVGCATLALGGGAVLSLQAYVPLYAQRVMNQSPFHAGLMVLSVPGGICIAYFANIYLLARWGYRRLIRVGFAVAAMGSALFALLLHRDVSQTLVVTTIGLFGIGYGMADGALTIALQTSIEKEIRGVVTAMNPLVASLGGTLTVGGLGAILTRSTLGDSSFGGMERGLRLGFGVIAALLALAFLIGLAFPRLPMSERTEERAIPVPGRSAG